ncbi:UNVERIFIED_CONTAM: hypothetical protein GTU68_006028 [Idotea baltica]|nr:hypothetical protein [Idotea baltica]
MNQIRIGQGYDVHAFSECGPLILGNVEIPSDQGLLGHSDADVLLHAIIDSLLGALAMGDIGGHFPDTDPKYAKVDSAKLFKPIWEKIQQEGWQLVNCDSVVIAEKPKLAPHINSIRKRLSELFGCDLSQVSVKATTSERLGFVGREEGIAAMATCLLEKR